MRAIGSRTQTCVASAPRIAFGTVGAVTIGLTLKRFAVGGGRTRIGYEARILALTV